MFTYLKMLFYDFNTLKSALNVGLQHLSWATTDTGAPVEGNLPAKLGMRGSGD
jgi:hypothetical protein